MCILAKKFGHVTFLGASKSTGPLRPVNTKPYCRPLNYDYHIMARLNLRTARSIRYTQHLFYSSTIRFTMLVESSRWRREIYQFSIWPLPEVDWNQLLANITQEHYLKLFLAKIQQNRLKVWRWARRFYFCSSWLKHVWWRFTACQIVFIKLTTRLAIWKILPETRSNGKQNIQFHNIIDLQ